jgi:hypothetical protein
MDEYEPKLLLFLSVDVIGSTAHKQRRVTQSSNTQHTRDWVFAFLYFHQEFPKYFDKHLNVFIEKLRQHDNSNYKIWKSLGDEIIFTVQLTHRTQIPIYIAAFKAALQEYHNELKAKHPDIGVKGSAWVAGFPVGNAVVRIGSGGETDFIGPQIDIGFRISKYSTRRKFVISIELAYMLTRITEPEITCEIYYDGQQEVKGVLANDQYPIFWVDCTDGKLTSEEEILSPPYSIQTPRITKFVREFISDNTPPLMLPFIENDDMFNEKPENYEKEVEKVRKATIDYLDQNVANKDVEDGKNTNEIDVEIHKK